MLRKDCFMPSPAEEPMPQWTQSQKRLLNPGMDVQPTEAPDQPTGDGTATPLQPTPPAKSSRLFFIDHLRVLLIILVIMHHLAITYGAAGSWYYQDPTKDTLT